MKTRREEISRRHPAKIKSEGSINPYSHEVLKLALAQNGFDIAKMHNKAIAAIDEIDDPVERVKAINSTVNTYAPFVAKKFSDNGNSGSSAPQITIVSFDSDKLKQLKENEAKTIDI